MRARFVVAAAALLATGLSAVPAGAGGGEEPLEATEIGVTDDTIRIAVIADVDNPARPGLFQGIGRRRPGGRRVHQRQGRDRRARTSRSTSSTRS